MTKNELIKLVKDSGAFRQDSENVFSGVIIPPDDFVKGEEGIRFTITDTGVVLEIKKVLRLDDFSMFLEDAKKEMKNGMPIVNMGEQE